VSAVLDTLVERRLVKVAGRKESIGRPLLYATTSDFLKSFGLRNLEDLPSIESLVPPGMLEVDSAKQTELPLDPETSATTSSETTPSPEVQGEPQLESQS